VYVRVVRFTDVNAEQLEAMLARIQEADGPPPGVSISRLETLHDPDQRTALSLQYYDTAEAMEAAGKIFDAMDASETPGTRVSVDACELKLTLGAS
jgi:hypothetical protein